MLEISDLKVDLEYISSGLFIAQDEWIHPRRIIDSYEIIFVMNGKVFLQEDETKYILNKNDAFILFPDRQHFGYQTSGEKTSFYWVHFKTSDFSALGLNDNRLISLPDGYNINSLFKQLLHVVNTAEYPKYTADLYMALIISELIFNLLNMSRKYSALAKTVAEWIRINCKDKNITVNSAAEYFQYNQDYLSKLFKASFGVGMKEYINTERIKLIKKYLMSSGYTVKQISVMMGYKDENSLIKFFKYNEGISPVRYKNTYYNTHINKI